MLGLPPSPLWFVWWTGIESSALVRLWQQLAERDGWSARALLRLAAPAPTTHPDSFLHQQVGGCHSVTGTERIRECHFACLRGVGRLERLSDSRNVTICQRSGPGSLDQSGIPCRTTPFDKIQKRAPGVA